MGISPVVKSVETVNGLASAGDSDHEVGTLGHVEHVAKQEEETESTCHHEDTVFMSQT